MRKVDDILTRRVEKILPSKEGLEKLMRSKKLRLYQGFDPTASRLHLGSTVGMRKLMDFANAGHEVIFLFGTGTVLVGDPSQRETGRKLITQKEINENIKNWKRQVSSVVDFKKVKIMQNGEWLVPLTLKDIVKIASKVSAVQLFKREMFQRRIKRGDTVWYHETMYPLLQGYDSVVMDVDLEIGGTDQEFNMLVGRELQKKMNRKEKFVLTVPMILGTDGEQMSKSAGNCVWLDDSAADMFAKLMAVDDKQTLSYLELVTNLSMEEVDSIRDSLESKKMHPMDAKKKLASAVVEEFHGKAAAEAARAGFEETVQKGGVPQKVPVYKTKTSTIDIVDVLVDSTMVQSRSAAKRLVAQGGVEWNGKKVENTSIDVDKSGTLKIGKYRFLKIER